MKRFFLFFFIAFSPVLLHAQVNVQSSIVKSDVIMNPDFIMLKSNPATPVKNQANTGTCWSFSTTSLLESQLLKNNLGSFDLSEMFTVRNIYIEKAANYILRQGQAQFGQGGLGHDVIRAVAKYGAIPENNYSGLLVGQTEPDHAKLEVELKKYLDGLLNTNGKPLPDDWMTGYTKILDEYMGAVPATFMYNGKDYTPLTFAKEVMHFRAGDYVNLTSFTSQPYYESFVVQVPDNFSNGAYYNLPLNEMIDVAKTSVSSGYSLMWDADVSNNGFRTKKGLALNFDPSVSVLADSVKVDVTEAKWDAGIRQKLFEDLVTQDDHLMHITGIETSKGGKTFFIVKNSWGNTGPYNGYINVSESYFAINTITLVVPKAALSKALLAKLKIN